MAIIGTAHAPIRIYSNKTGFSKTIGTNSIYGSSVNYTGIFYSLPVATQLKASWETLDSSSTGRNNSTGAMFRDKVADKGKWELTLPTGMTNTITMPDVDGYKPDYQQISDNQLDVIYEKPPDWGTGYYYYRINNENKATDVTAISKSTSWASAVATAQKTMYKNIYRVIPYYLISGVPQLLKIVSAGDFYLKAPDTLTGKYKLIHAYCSSLEPEILRVTETNYLGDPIKWIYKSFSINFIEM